MTTTSRSDETRTLDRLGAIAGLADHFQIRLAVDEQSQTLPHSLVVFHQEYAQPPGHGEPPCDQVWYAAVGASTQSVVMRDAEARRPVLDLYSSSDRTLDWDQTVGEQGRENNRTLSEDVLRLVVEDLPDHAVVTLDPHGVVTFWNAGAEHLFGWSSEQAMRVHVSSLLGPGGQDAGIGTTELEAAKRQGVGDRRTAVEPSGRQHQRRQNDHFRASDRDRRAGLRHRGAPNGNRAAASRSSLCREQRSTTRRRRRRVVSCLNRGPCWPRRSLIGRRPKHPGRGCSAGSSSPRRTNDVDSPRTSTMASVSA